MATCALVRGHLWGLAAALALVTGSAPGLQAQGVEPVGPGTPS